MTKSILIAAALAGLIAGALVDPAQAQSQGRPSTASPASPRFTLDTPLARIAADPQGRAFLERRMPGLVGSPNFLMVRSRSLRQLSTDPHAQGLSPATLARLEVELRAIR